MWQIVVGEIVRRMRDFYTLEISVSSCDLSKLLGQEHREAILAHVGRVEELCSSALLESPGPKIARIRITLNDPTPVTAQEAYFMVRELRERIEDELQDRVFMLVQPHRVQYCMNRALFGDEVNTAFPLAVFDIVGAGNCYACGQFNPTVFHSMRVLEHGLEWISGQLGVEFGLDSWHVVLNKIESEIKEMQKQARGPSKIARLTFYSEAAKEFTYFKDAWRNHVMHGRGNYDEEASKRIMDHVGHFMKQLAPQVLSLEGLK